MTEPENVRVFVNGQPVSVVRGGTVVDAIRLHDPATADAVVAGTRAATDSRGLPIALDAVCSGGLVLRIVSARALTAHEDDA